MTSATNNSVILTETIIDHRYKIDKHETEGLQGRIYKAVDIRKNKIVALKILKQRFAKRENWLDHFRDVPGKLEKLVNCDNVVRILGYGHPSDDPPDHDYHVTEWVDGHNLDVWRDQHDEDRNKWVKIAIGLCRGVKACHEVGLTHGDIKPNNIMIAEGPDVTSASAILVDFGLARYDEDQSTPQRAGTLRYMAPEVLTQEENAGQPSDIYSLGLVLFFLFTGEHCWPQEDNNELHRAIVHDEPPTLYSVSAGAQIDDLDVLLRRMLDKTPANRPEASDALSALEAIDRALDGTLFPAVTTTSLVAMPSNEVTRKVGHWRKYLDIWERMVKETKWQVRYKGFLPTDAKRPRDERHAISLTLEPDLYVGDIPWEKIKNSLDDYVALAPQDGYPSKWNEKFGELTGLNEFNNTVEIEFERNDRFYKKYWDASQGKYTLPPSGTLVYDAFGDISQIQQQKTALDKLESGKTNNSRLNRFIFDASRASPLPERPKFDPLGSNSLLQPKLNSKQLRAVEGALNAPDLYLIQGPPGTGKTTVIAELCYQFVLRRQRVLIASQANLAIDNAMSKLMHHHKIMALRLVKPGKVEEEGKPFLAERVMDTWFKGTADKCEEWIEHANQRLKNFSELLDNMDKLSKYAELLEGHENQLSGLKKQVDDAQKNIDSVHEKTRQITAKQAEISDLTDLLDEAEKIFQDGHILSENPDAPFLWHRRGLVGIDPVASEGYQQFLTAVVWALETVIEIPPGLDQESSSLITSLAKNDRVLFRRVREGNSDARTQLRNVTAVLRIGQHLANIVRDRLPELRGVEEKIAPMKELFGHRRPLLGLVATREVDTALRASERSIESHRQYIKHLRQLEKEEESLDSIIESVSAAEAQIRQEMDRQQQMQGLHSAAGERMRLCANQLGDMSRCSDDFQRIQETEAEQNAQLQSLLNTQPKQHSVVVNLLLGIQDSPGESFGENGRWLDWNPENDLEALPLPLRNRLRGRNLPLLLGLWKRAWEFLGQVGGNPTDTRHRSFLSTEDNSKEVKDTEDALSQLFATGPDGKENARASATVERGFADILNKTSEQIRYTALKNFLPRLIQVVANERDELNQSIREILADIGDTSTVAEKQQDQTQKLKSTERDRKALSTEWINHTASWNEHLDFITARIDAINTIGQQNFFQESTLLLGQAAVTGTSFKPFKFELLRKTFEKELRELQASLEPSREVIYKEDLAKLEEKKSSQVTVVNECKERLSAVHRKLKNSLAKLEDTRDTFVGDATGEQDESTHNFVQHLEELHGLLSEERNATKTGAIFKKLEDNGANIVAQLRGKAGPRPRKTSLDKQLAEVDEQIHAEIGRLTEQGYDPAHWPTPLSGERHSANSLDIWRNRVDRLEDVSKEAESVLASLQPTVVLDHVRKQAAEKELPLEYELETANGTKERHKEKLEEAKKALEKYETQYGEEQDWWAEKHGSIPVSLRVSGRQAPDIHHPFYIWELIDLHNSDPQRWSDELERQRGLEKTATPIARDWIVRLRQRREEDLATLKPDFIEKANVIGVTCGAAASELTKHTDEGPDRRTPFDVVIIDESSRATLPELLLAILEGKKTVLVGDQKQLPPILLPNVSEEIAAEYEDVEREELRHLETPLFGKLYNTAPDSLRAMLTIQYRMRPAIMGAINQFYEHKLTGGEAVKQHGMHIGPLEPGTSIAWVHTPLNKDNRETTDRRKSKTNKEEVAFIKLMLQKMNASWERAMGADKTLQRKEVGVITFYKAQEWRLKEAIVERGNSDNFRALDIRIGTVDRFQGMERSVVLVSLVRNNKNGNIGFTDRPERINVAFSRARELLVIVGCKTLFTQKAENATKALSIYNKVSEVVRRRGLGISVSDFQLN